jgi:hypothetical protein
MEAITTQASNLWELGGMIFDNLIWLNTIEAAVYLRKFTKDGLPSVGAIRNMVYRGYLKPRKLRGRLLFKRRELDDLLESSFA